MTIEDRLKELNIVLPEAQKPVGSYATSVIAGDMLYLTCQVKCYLIK